MIEVFDDSYQLGLVTTLSHSPVHMNGPGRTWLRGRGILNPDGALASA